MFRGPDREGSSTLAERRTDRGAGPRLAHAGRHRPARSRARRDLVRARVIKNNYFAEMCRGSDEGLYLRRIDFCITQL